MRLAEFLSIEEQRIGLTALSGKIGVAHTSLRRLTAGNYKSEMETFIRIADAYGLSLWRVLEMAGYDLGLPDSSIASQRAARTLADSLSEFDIERIARATPDEIVGVAAWLAAIDIRRGTQSRMIEQTPGNPKMGSNLSNGDPLVNETLSMAGELYKRGLLDRWLEYGRFLIGRRK